MLRGPPNDLPRIMLPTREKYSIAPNTVSDVSTFYGSFYLPGVMLAQSRPPSQDRP